MERFYTGVIATPLLTGLVISRYRIMNLFQPGQESPETCLLPCEGNYSLRHQGEGEVGKELGVDNYKQRGWRALLGSWGAHCWAGVEKKVDNGAGIPGGRGDGTSVSGMSSLFRVRPGDTCPPVNSVT